MTISTSPLAQEVALLRTFDGRLESELSGAELHELREVIGRARRSLDGVTAAMAGEIARRSSPELGAAGFARKEGFASPQQFLAKTLGTSPGDAWRLISVGNSLAPRLGPDAARDADSGSVAEPERVRPRYPHVAEAVSGGRLGIEFAALIGQTLDAIREAMEADATAESEIATEVAALERRLVDKAPTLRLADLRRVCDRERAWRSPKEVAAKERRHVANRSLYFGEDADGMTTMTARMDAASAAPIKAWVDAQTKWAFRQRRDVSEGGAGIPDSRMPGQIRLDALATLARHGLGCEKPTTGVKSYMVVRVDEGDVRSRLGIADGDSDGDQALGECDQLNGPITVGTLRAMAVEAQIISVTLGGDSLPLDLGYGQRLFSVAQKIALLERDGGCSWCHAPPSFCEAHHIKWWAQDLGRTDLDKGATRQYTL